MSNVEINEQIKTEVKGDYDVAVCGGGFAGTTAMTDDFSALNVNELQDVLRKNGVVIHEQEII